MVRVKNLDASLAFYQLLGMRELRRSEVPDGKYTLVFVGYGDNAQGQAEIELTYNWGDDDGYEVGTASATSRSACRTSRRQSRKSVLAEAR